MKVVLASSNRHKIAELQEMLEKSIPDIEILSLSDIGFADEIVEDGKTFEENALIKARAVASRGYIGIGDDSGLTTDALGGAPGIYSARYAGEHGNDAANRALLLKNMKGIENRNAAFVCAIACVFPDGSSPIVCLGKCEGVILDSEEGNGGFGYDPLFKCNQFEHSFGVVSPEQKNAVSHRGAAIRAFAAEFAKRVKENRS